MNTLTVQPDASPPWRQVLIEVLLVFAVFFLQGASPVPDVNEPYYLGKAIHYWNPDWIPSDFFLDTKDTHKVFYFTLGWLSLWLTPDAMAWTGRLLTWALLAWAWRRLSFAVVPRRWYSILTAALLVCLIQRCHMAGEWLIGGVEAKGFAYVLVLLGIEAVVRNRFNRAWLLLGAAAAFHVLVGGWAVVAAGIAWLGLGRDRPRLVSMLPALAGGLLLSLPGLLPSLLLDRGTDPEIVRQAHIIYVYERLYHHLAISRMPVHFIVRFVLLCVLWLVLWWKTSSGEALRRLHWFVAGTVVIALVGAAISPLEAVNRGLTASLLRFYWYRLADVMVPLGVSLAVASYIARSMAARPAWGKGWLAVATTIAVLHVGSYAVWRASPRVPPADRLPGYEAWCRACNWIAESGEIPENARFITPRMAQTFKWYTRRSEVANWKDIPQDAASIVEWWNRITLLHDTGHPSPLWRWREPVGSLGSQRLKELGKKYGAQYVITVRADEPLDLPILHEERFRHRDRRRGYDSYIIYQLDERED